MKQIVRYRFMTIPNKLYADVRVTVDESSHSETKSSYEGGKSTTLVLLPMINIQMLRPLETDENGRRYRPQSSMNDSIGLTKFNYPIFVNELNGIYEDMRTPDLYVYTGDRLDLNEKAAEKIRRAFTIGRTSIEFKAVVIEQPTDSGTVERLEGIKMKFNNEESTVLLTLREIESMLWIMKGVDIDNIVLTMYLSFVERSAYEPQKPVVDIVPTMKPTRRAVETVAVNSVVEPQKKEEPPKQETVINIPAEKYTDFDSVSKEDFAKYMNPPVETQAE